MGMEMTLVSCEECNHQISNQASVCPNCGYNVERHREEQVEDYLAELTISPLFLYFVITISGLYHGYFSENHPFFTTTLFSIFWLDVDWFYTPLLFMAGGIITFKQKWWGGWVGGFGIPFLIYLTANYLLPTAL